MKNIISALTASRKRLWGTISALFVFASAAQVAIYACPWLLRGKRGYAPRSPDDIIFFFGPALCGVVVASYLLYLKRRENGFSAPEAKPINLPLSFVAVIMLALISIYIGILISFNRYGT